jgi:cytochrome c5
MHRRVILLAVVFSLTLLSSISTASAAQASGARTVLEGVYTAEQARRGGDAYQASCSSCHRDDLTGLHASALKGAFFMDRWREFKLEVLFNTIVETMPRSAPRSLGDDVYLDILAFILQANEVPAGNQTLNLDITKTTLLVGKDGPKPLPTSTPVDVTGCLVMAAGNTWLLVRASERARTINQWELTPEDTSEARARPLGDQRFRLQDFQNATGFSPSLVNNRIEVKGLLVRQPGNERINVSAVQLLAPGCQ